MSDDFRINTASSRGPHAPMRRGPAPLRDLLRIAGPALAAIGLCLLIVGLGDFFMAFGTFRPPRYFWCAFVGMPLLAGGVALTRFAYLGPLARYVAEETAPVGRDVINYLARGTEPAVRAVAGALKEEWSQSPGEERKSCPQCGQRNDADARFCAHCGGAMTATAVCAHCGAKNAPSASFCDQCGHSLASA
ncbi:MAG TPA: zinc ribbon domain-containing protein [Pirellulales bacterium]